MDRKAGILMPIFSLPSKYGIGSFDTEAYKFVDWLKKAGQTYWQILPLVPTSYGDSPYQSFSTYARIFNCFINRQIRLMPYRHIIFFSDNLFCICHYGSTSLFFSALMIIKKWR